MVYDSDEEKEKERRKEMKKACNQRYREKKKQLLHDEWRQLEKERIAREEMEKAKGGESSKSNPKEDSREEFTSLPPREHKQKAVASESPSKSKMKNEDEDIKEDATSVTPREKKKRANVAELPSKSKAKKTDVAVEEGSTSPPSREHKQKANGRESFPKSKVKKEEDNSKEEPGSVSPSEEQLPECSADEATRKAEALRLKREREQQRISIQVALMSSEKKKEEEKARHEEEERKRRLERRLSMKSPPKRKKSESSSPSRKTPAKKERPSSKTETSPIKKEKLELKREKSPEKREVSPVRREKSPEKKDKSPIKKEVNKYKSASPTKQLLSNKRPRTSSLVSVSVAAAETPQPQKAPAKRGRKSRATMAAEAASTSTPRKKANKPSPMKTRGLQKKTEKANAQSLPRCAICRQSKGELANCAECHAYYHLRKCMLYSEETAKAIEAGKRQRWLCARCASCGICGDFIADPNNIECNGCGLAFHGKCRRKGGYQVERHFYCSPCYKILLPSLREKKEQMEAKEVKTTATEISPRTAARRGRKPKEVTEKRREILEASQKIIDERDQLYNQIMDTVTAGTRSTPNSPRRKAASRSPEKNRRMALQADADLFEAAKKALRDETAGKQEIMPLVPGSQWIYVGSRREKMQALYSSLYAPDISSALAIFICPFCLRPNNNKTSFAIHQHDCTWRHPPGDEIYRNSPSGISFFEVDGAMQKNYCQRVCLLGKLFISSKTLVHEVETFLFYVLTEHTEDGCEFVGYFSKEKNPSKNNNLSCLLTLPSAQRSGYGRLLIDLSYQLSRLERKIGSPEHPLSDLGLFAYRGFWKSAILCHLRSLRGHPSTTVKQMSLATRIAPNDIINQLLRDGLLLYKDGVYYVNTERRAYRLPLAACRRHTVECDKLLWKPKFDITQLDPTKLNYYV